MIDAAIVAAVIVLVIVTSLAVVAWLVRAPLLRLIAEAVLAEQRREQERRRGQRPTEVFREVPRSGVSSDGPEVERHRERVQRAIEIEGKIEAGRAIAQERGWTT